MPLQLSLAPTPSAAGRARDALAEWLGARSVEDAAVECALLVATELITNCVRHALMGKEDLLTLKAQLQDDLMRFEIRDSGTDGTVAMRRVERDSIGGFGLRMVDRISTRWGVERDAGGTTVWAEIPSIGPAAG